MFRYDNPIMRFLSKAVDVFLVNLLWVICSIPILTIGASTTAMYYVTLKIVRDEDGSAVRAFFHSFSKNFKQATIIWLIMLIIPIALCCYLYFYLSVLETEGILRFLITTAGLVILVFWVAIFTYIFPSIARFENPIKQIFYNAFAMSIANLGDTAIMLLVDVGLIYFTLKIFPLLGVAGIAWFNSYRLHKVFHKYIEPEDSGEERLCAE